MSDREVSDQQDPISAPSYAAALVFVMVLAHTARAKVSPQSRLPLPGTPLHLARDAGPPGDHRRVSGRAVAVGGADPIAQYPDPEVVLPADFQHSIPALDVNCLRSWFAVIGPCQRIDQPVQALSQQACLVERSTMLRGAL
jgi:hypothetical protein